MNSTNIDILIMAEVRREGIIMKRFYIFYYIGETVAQCGVGFWIKTNLKLKIINFKGVSVRIAVIDLELKYDQCLRIVYIVI